MSTPITIAEAIQLALHHHQTGRLPDAENLYRLILQTSPREADALHLLGVLYVQTGRAEAAVELIRQALAINPQLPGGQSNLGLALHHANRLEEALEAFRQALAVMPDAPEIHYNIGLTLKRQGRLEQAAAAFRQALALRPEYAEAHNDLGNVLQGQGRYEEAAASHQRALTLRPDWAEAVNNLGGALQACGQLEAAVACHEKAVGLSPNDAEYHANLSGAYAAAGRMKEASDACLRARELDPGNAPARAMMLWLLLQNPECPPEAHTRAAREWGAYVMRPLQGKTLAPARAAEPERRLRIGYVSPDFKRHSVACFFLPLLEAHDHERFHVMCYYTGERTDDITDRCRAGADQWRRLAGLTDLQAAAQIAADEIDILVDLAGHTEGGRLMIFAHKPAPVQVSFLGYPGTTGLPAIDYRLTDALADPPDMTDHLCVERLVRLPHTAWCFLPLLGSPAIGPPPARKRGYITFGSLNRFTKIVPAVLEMWVEILHRLPTSRLLLKSSARLEAAAFRRFVDFFATRGIAAERVQVTGWLQEGLEHLQTYHQVDIVLDTFPYHGTTTTCETLWMGVPVVTLAGAAHLSRVGVSLLQNVGLADLAARSREEYVARAVELAEDLPRLETLRRTLRQRMQASPLMDGAAYARDVEGAYRTMWQAWCGGRAPSENHGR